MKLSKSASFANTAIVANVTYRMVGTYGVGILLGGVLFMTPVFRWNWLAMIAYVAFASILIGQTPTRRTVLLNLYAILFKKPIKMVVSDLSTTTTIGHGIREVILDEDTGQPIFKMSDGHFAWVFNITSGINQWSSDQDYHRQAVLVKNLFNVFEGGESLMIITKADADTGMLQLEEALNGEDNFDPNKRPDLARLSAQRKNLLHAVATRENGRSVQQYAVLKIKRKNINRTSKALRRASRIIRPATNPADVLLSAMALEGGVDLGEIANIETLEKGAGNIKRAGEDEE